MANQGRSNAKYSKRIATGNPKRPFKYVYGSSVKTGRRSATSKSTSSTAVRKGRTVAPVKKGVRTAPRPLAGGALMAQQRKAAMTAANARVAKIGVKTAAVTKARLAPKPGKPTLSSKIGTQQRLAAVARPGRVLTPVKAVTRASQLARRAQVAQYGVAANTRGVMSARAGLLAGAKRGGLGLLSAVALGGAAALTAAVVTSKNR